MPGDMSGKGKRACEGRRNGVQDMRFPFRLLDQKIHDQFAPDTVQHLRPQADFIAPAQMFGAQTGNQAVNSAGLNLRAISMLPEYNPTYAGVLAAANAAGTVYGVGKQQNWWGGGNAAPTGAPPVGAPYWSGAVPSGYGRGL